MDFHRFARLAYNVGIKNKVIRIPWPVKKINIKEQVEFVKKWEYFIQNPEYSYLEKSSPLIKDIKPENIKKLIN